MQHGGFPDAQSSEKETKLGTVTPLSLARLRQGSQVQGQLDYNEIFSIQSKRERERWWYMSVLSAFKREKRESGI